MADEKRYYLQDAKAGDLESSVHGDIKISAYKEGVEFWDEDAEPKTTEVIKLHGTDAWHLAQQLRDVAHLIEAEMKHCYFDVSVE
jgi:hypothetical protein